jgi:hypothetical protein
MWLPQAMRHACYLNVVPPHTQRSICYHHSLPHYGFSLQCWGYVKYEVTPEPAGSSPYSQESATGPYPEATGSSLHSQPVFIRSILIPSSRLRLGFPSGLFPSGFPTKTFYTFSPLPCMPHIPPT